MNAQHLNASIGEADVADEFMSRGCPRNLGVRREFQQARFYRNAADFKIVVARKNRLRMNVVSIQTDEIADFGVVEIGSKIVCSKSVSVCWTN